MTVVGSIQSVITPGIYLVRDSSGRLHRASGVATWRKGDRVAIVEGQIVGSAGVSKTSTVYEV